MVYSVKRISALINALPERMIAGETNVHHSIILAGAIE